MKERINLVCVLRGDANDLKRIREYIMKEYVSTGLAELIKCMYDRKEIHLLTDTEWEECQRLKRMIGAGFP